MTDHDLYRAAKNEGLKEFKLSDGTFIDMDQADAIFPTLYTSPSSGGYDADLPKNEVRVQSLIYALARARKSSGRLNKDDIERASLTLNLYGIAPTDENTYANIVFGISLLNIDHIYQSKLSGERNGKQAFTSINFRTKNRFGKFNTTPSLKFDLGVTQLSEMTDFIRNTNDPLIKNITYKKDTFQSGELAAGFLFELDKYITEAGSLQTMGGLELLYDLSPDNSYKYIYEGQTHVSEDVIRKHTNKNLKYNIGFEMIYLNGFTLSSNFEKIMSIKKNGKSKSDRDTFIFKISRSKEEDDEFAFNYNPLNNHQSTLSYQKNINGFNYSINHNQIFDNSLKHDTNIEVSSKF